MQRFLVIILTLIFPLTCLGDDPSELYDHYIKLANEAEFRKDRIDYFRKAIESSPENPKNINLEFKIATALAQHQNPEKGEKPQTKEGLEVYESILKNYSYMDYYKMTPDPGDYYPGQYIMVQSAIQAGCIYIYELNDQVKGQEYLYLAMEFLKKTHDQRMSDWEMEEKPSPPDKEMMEILGIEGERRIAAYPQRVKEWEERKHLMSIGEVFNDSELSNVRIAVKHYGLSDGPQPPEMVPVAMEKIIIDFAGTPIAKRALMHVENSKEMVTKNNKGK